jgi:CheY-like chemotaxis protein
METLLNILYLEDDPFDVKLVVAKLEQASLDCRVTCAQTRGEFEKALEKGRVDIILADYRLPLYDGMSALLLCES